MLPMPAMILNQHEDSKRVVIFLHIPKTGGRTLGALLDKQYVEYCDTWKSYRWQERYLFSPYKSLEIKKRIEALRGHQFFGIHKLLPQNNFTYITFLRNPVERIISTYYFIRTTKNPDLRELRNILNQVTLYQYVTNKEFDYIKHYFIATDNLQTRMLCGKPNEADLGLAKHNLVNYFSIAGITERFDETLSIIKKKLGWQWNYYKKLGVNPDRPSIAEIEQAVIDVIKEKNKKDIELYSFTNKLLDKYK